MALCSAFAAIPICPSSETVATERIPSPALTLNLNARETPEAKRLELASESGGNFPLCRTKDWRGEATESYLPLTSGDSRQTQEGKTIFGKRE